MSEAQVELDNCRAADQYEHADDILDPEANKRAILRYHQAKQEEAAQTAVPDRSQTRARVGAGSVYPDAPKVAEIGAQRLQALGFTVEEVCERLQEFAKVGPSIADLSAAGFTEES